MKLPNPDHPSNKIHDKVQTNSIRFHLWVTCLDIAVIPTADYRRRHAPTANGGTLLLLEEPLKRQHQLAGYVEEDSQGWFKRYVRKKLCIYVGDIITGLFMEVDVANGEIKSWLEQNPGEEEVEMFEVGEKVGVKDLKGGRKRRAVKRF